MGIKDIITKYDKQIIFNTKILACIDDKGYMQFALYKNEKDELNIYYNLYHHIKVNADDYPFIMNNRETECNTFELVDIKNFQLYVRHNIEMMLDVSKEIESSNYNLIVKEFEKDGGNIVKFDFDSYGLLVAVSSTDEDYYWVYLNLDKENKPKINFSSCVGGYEVIKENELTDELRKVRDKFQKNLDETIFFIEEYFEKHLNEVIFANVKVIP